MQGFGTEKNNILINFTLRVIPLFTLCATWYTAFDIKSYIGGGLLNSNKFTCILGFLIVFGIMFLKINLNFKYITNALGNRRNACRQRAPAFCLRRSNDVFYDRLWVGGVFGMAGIQSGHSAAADDRGRLRRVHSRRHQNEQGVSFDTKYVCVYLGQRQVAQRSQKSRIPKESLQPGYQ